MSRPSFVIDPLYPPSQAHLTWRAYCPDHYAYVAENDPEHLAKLAAGWSFVELVLGPRDGAYYYHVGSPQWEIQIGDDDDSSPPKYRYVLHPHVQGHAVYLYAGEIPKP